MVLERPWQRLLGTGVLISIRLDAVDRRSLHQRAQKGRAEPMQACCAAAAVLQEAPATSRRLWTLIASTQAPLLLIAKSAGSERRPSVGTGPNWPGCKRLTPPSPLRRHQQCRGATGMLGRARCQPWPASPPPALPASMPLSSPCLQPRRHARPAAGTHLYVGRSKGACVSGGSACSAGCAALYAGGLASKVPAAGTLPVSTQPLRRPSLAHPISAGPLRCWYASAGRQYCMAHQLCGASWRWMHPTCLLRPRRPGRPGRHPCPSC